MWLFSKHFPILNTNLQKMSGSQEKQCWWEKALYSPLFPASQCEGKHLCLLELTFCCTHIRMKCSLLWIRIAADELDLLSVF